MSIDLTEFPALTFGEIETYVKDKSIGCPNSAKGYKYFAELGYLHDINCKCCLSARSTFSVTVSISVY